jgi:hypothetical protein
MLYKKVHSSSCAQLEPMKFKSISRTTALLLK